MRLWRSRSTASESSVPGYVGRDEAGIEVEREHRERLAELSEALERIRRHLLETRPSFDFMAEVQPNDALLANFPVWHLGRYDYEGGGSYSSGSCDVCMDEEGRLYKGIAGLIDPTTGEDRRAFQVFVESTSWKPSRREPTPAVPVEDVATYYIFDYESQWKAISQLTADIRQRYPAAGI